MLELVERLVTKKVNNHVEANVLGNKAYKTWHSTENALLFIQNDVRLTVSKGKATAVILLDLSAAFHTIDHDTLFDRISSWLGIGGS